MTTAGTGGARSPRLAIPNPRRLLGPDDLQPHEGGYGIPRIVRFVANDESPHLGLVLESRTGVPVRLLDLSSRYGYGPSFLGFASAGGFEVAARELSRSTSGAADNETVTLSPDELASRLLSPVDIALEELARQERLVIGFGLTFRRHRDETRGGRPFAFPKPTSPSGAYCPVAFGASFAGDAAAHLLLDYELELGCVTLRDLDLDDLAHVDRAKDFAYLMVNDVTAREPILRDRREGYTRGKARPTFLPCGPWVISGDHFIQDAPSLRRMVLTVDEALPHADHPSHTLRQDARLEDLTLGLGELLALVAKRRDLTMPDHLARRWPISVRRGHHWIIPAGSLLLTGTPGGTAIRAPRLSERALLVWRSLRYRHWPAEGYRRHLVDHRHALGFLSPGDRVKGWISGLGLQDWCVVRSDVPQQA